VKVRYIEDKEFLERKGFKRCPDLTDGKIYEAEDETFEMLGEIRRNVYDDDSSGNYDEEDPTPYPVEYFEVVG
jgi:hypothetical protein